MIERIIEYSIRKRVLVLVLAAGLAVWGIYAVLHTPIDAVPDQSENQVIVFTDWMGRSPREIEDQVTYPLSLKLQGLAGVKTLRSSSEFNFSMTTIIFEDGVDYYFARQRAPGIPDRREPGVAARLRRHAGRRLRRRVAQQLRGGRRRHPEEQRRVP